MIAEFPAPGVQPVGGPQVAVRRLVSKLVERGVDVVIVAPDSLRSSEAVMEIEDGVTLIAVPAGRRWTLARGLQPWRRRAGAVVERIGADLAHGQGLLPGLIAGDVKQCPGVVTARGNARADTMAAYRGAGGMARAYLRNQFARAAVHRADVVIGVNPDWTVNVPRRPKRFVYIPNMIDEDYFFRRTREPEPGLVLFAGGTRAIKGWTLLAEAWPRVREAVPDACLHVVGWTPSQAPSEIAIGDRESLVVEGWLSSAALADRMARASALVIPSQFEVSPIVLAEAWALGLPVVAVPVGGIPALANGAAVLVERQPETLAEGIVAALAGGDEIDKIVEEGRRRAEAHRPGSVVAAHIALYEEIVHQDGQ